MNSSYCLNMSLCNNHENNETNIYFYKILLNACAKGTCSCDKKRPVPALRDCGKTAAMVILKIHTPVVLDKVAIVLTGNVIYN